MNPEAYSVTELAEHWGLSTEVVRRLIRTGMITARKFYANGRRLKCDPPISRVAAMEFAIWQGLKLPQ